MAGAAGSRHKHSLPDLPYDYGALEPHINAQIMQLHHSKHHAAYVNNLNATEEKYHEALAKGDVTTQVALQPALKFNGGGHINHTIFWTNLSPKGGGEPKGWYKLLQLHIWWTVGMIDVFSFFKIYLFIICTLLYATTL